jgi:hypothetical protein
MNEIQPAQKSDRLTDAEVRTVAMARFWHNVNRGDDTANDVLAEQALAEWRSRPPKPRPST